MLREHPLENRRAYATSGPVVTLQLVPLAGATPLCCPVDFTPLKREGSRRKRSKQHADPKRRERERERERDGAGVQPSRDVRRRDRADTPVLSPVGRPRHDQYYAPELRHPNRPRDGLLPVPSIQTTKGEMQLSGRKFHRNRKPEIRWSAAAGRRRGGFWLDATNQRPSVGKNFGEEVPCETETNGSFFFISFFFLGYFVFIFVST